MVVDAGGDVSGAGNSVTVDSTVELDDCGLGGHRGMTVLHQTPLTAEQDAETPVELWTKSKRRDALDLRNTVSKM